MRPRLYKRRRLRHLIGFLQSISKKILEQSHESALPSVRVIDKSGSQVIITLSLMVGIFTTWHLFNAKSMGEAIGSRNSKYLELVQINFFCRLIGGASINYIVLQLELNNKIILYFGSLKETGNTEPTSKIIPLIASCIILE